MAETNFIKMAATSVLWVLILLFMVAPNCYGRRTRISKKELEIHEHLKKFNKPPLKSIKSPDGDIIDCVHISNQPAFDHPLLQNHKIQLRPNNHPEGLLRKNEAVITNSISQLWQLKGNCPEGTIPVRRTKRSDVIRASSIKNYGKKKKKKHKVSAKFSAPNTLITLTGHQHAIAYVEGDEYYGAKATMNVWGPDIQQPNEFSLSQLWILAGSFASDLNSIEAGWQVSPDLYGDNNTRLFTYWTSDAYESTGCYNLLCSGFVQINNEIALGATIFPISSYHGSQYDIDILVWKDPDESNWWMQFGDDHVIGYWPGFLFSYLTESASMIEWGGEVVNSESDGEHTTTQMGSGHFPQEGFGKASYFRNIQIVDSNNNFRLPTDLSIFTEQPKCYDAHLGNSGPWGTYFYYGGPGRNPNCP
ncbi:uncharacterized protein LOC124938545 [Impatiens glandulifera]|uniref:uncharacterized protein LOC124938545 n=1 Tax=Impatiens glandulifera TaxID=253017 RepID=UPI001FB18AA2|nr:uncharacterized protein LOC124938545 [Impatiens glandulifera]